MGVTRVKEPSLTFPDKIKSNASFSVDRIADNSLNTPKKEPYTDVKKLEKNQKSKNNFKLP